MLKNIFIILSLLITLMHAKELDVGLTQEEQAYLEENRVTYAGDPNWLPFEAFDKSGNYTGIIAEHIEILENRLNKKFDKIITRNWLDTLELSKKRSVDIISGDAADVVLSQNYKAIDTYIKNPLVIVTRKEHQYIDDLNSIKDKKIAFGDGGGYTVDILKKYPDIKFVKCDTPQSGLLGVKTGQYDAFIGTLAMSDYTMVQMGIEDIKIAGQVGIVMNLTLFVDKDKPLLHSIINKSIKTITKAKQHEIISKWRGTKVQKVIDYTLVWQISLVFFVLFLTGLFFTLTLRSRNRKLKQAEQHLSERFKLAFDVGRDGLWYWNLIDDTLYFSPRWKEMLGYRDDELESSFETWESRVHPDDLEEALTNIELCIKEKKKVSENKHRLQHKDGHWIWIYDRGQVEYDSNGTAIRMFGTHTDLTTEMDLSDELSQLHETLETRVQEQVKELDRQHQLIAQKTKLASMGEMLNSIAHQWRQPLNCINSDVAVISSIVARDTIDKEMVLSQIHKVENNTQYMSETIENFSNFFRLNKQKREFILHDTVKTTLELLEPRSRDIEINIIHNKEAKLYSFQEEYQQVLMIILNNAIDNFESRRIKNPKIDIVIGEDKHTIYLSICDNGGGIEEENIDRIFDPYFTTKFADEGVGLGLYMGKMIIEESVQGKLEVANKNEGVCFKITVPIGVENA